MNVTELIQRTREILGETPQITTAPTQWTDAEILRAINSGYMSAWNAARGADEQWGMDFKLLSELAPTIVYVGGFAHVTLPVELGDILYVEDDTSATNDQGNVVPHVGVAKFRSSPGRYDFVSPRFRRWTFGGAQNVLLFSQESGFDSSKVRVWFARHVPALARFTVSTYPGANTLRVDRIAGATLGVLSQDDLAYRNTWIQCTVVTADAAPEGRKFFATGWSAATHPNFDLSLTAAHGASGTTVWETLPLIPEPHHELLAWLGALRALAKNGESTLVSLIANEVGRLRDEFIGLIENRQMQTPRYVNHEG